MDSARKRVLMNYINYLTNTCWWYSIITVDVPCYSSDNNCACRCVFLCLNSLMDDCEIRFEIVLHNIQYVRTSPILFLCAIIWSWRFRALTNIGHVKFSEWSSSLHWTGSRCLLQSIITTTRPVSVSSFKKDTTGAQLKSRERVTVWMC